MRLLIIEDDRDAAEYLVKAFREAGHIADHAGDGEDGLQLGLEGDYDVLSGTAFPSSARCARSPLKHRS